MISAEDSIKLVESLKEIPDDQFVIPKMPKGSFIGLLKSAIVGSLLRRLIESGESIQIAAILGDDIEPLFVMGRNPVEVAEFQAEDLHLLLVRANAIIAREASGGQHGS